MIEQERGETTLRDLPKEIDECRRIILGELRLRSLWFIRLRWWVPPAIILGTFLALSIGAQLEAGFLLGVALFVLAYNIFFHL